MMHPLDFHPMYCPATVVVEPISWLWLALACGAGALVGAVAGGWLVAEMVRGQM